VHLNGLTKLEERYLNGTKVTDAGLAPLRELTSLRHLDLRHTNVTVEAVIELSKALPNCRIALFSS